MPLVCERCGKSHDGSYGSGRFCSLSCAKSFSGSNRSIESRLKTGKSVAREHLHVCPICKVEFMHVGTSASTLCDRCYSLAVLNGRRLKHCKYCGNFKGQCRRPDVCKSFKLFPKMVLLFGMDPRAIGTERVYSEYDRVSKLIHDLYWGKKLSIALIAEHCGASSGGSIASFLRHFIDFRHMPDAVNNAISLRKPLQVPIEQKSFKTGWHVAWNGKKVFFRSSYEEDFCKELDKQKIDYQMESLTILYYDSQKRKNRFAIPDFFIPERNLIVEIKSSYTIDKQNMLDKFKRYLELGYSTLLVCDHVEYHGMDYFE